MTNFPSIKGLQITLRPAADLRPYAKNARTHSPEQIDIICKSLLEFGWTNPILVDGDNGVVAGHGRLLAAQKLGYAEVPCIELAHLTPAQRRAYVIADNQTALRAGWDLATLKLELGALSADGFNLEPLGFSVEELGALLAPAGTQGLTDPDAVPDVPEHPVALPGDLWALGRHWLLCGDATSAEDSQKVLRGVAPHLMVTDPPYGVKYDPSWRVGLHRTKRDGSALDKPAYAATGDVRNDDRADWREAWALFPGEVAYVWSAPGPLQIISFDGLVASGFDPRYQIIWAKPHFALGRGDYHWQHEPCWYAVRKGAKSHWGGDRTQTSLWKITSGVGFTTQKEGKDARTGHGTQKPVECMKRPIENNSSPGQAVYEPFSGSGTTIIAAEMTGRACHAIEINPAYVDVAIKRWQAFTGMKATLADDGRTFDEIGHERSRKAA
jgi:DNA modification methylase